MVVFEDFRYTGSYEGDTGHVLEFACVNGWRPCCRDRVGSGQPILERP
jgi:hypothetical protein